MSICNRPSEKFETLKWKLVCDPCAGGGGEEHGLFLGSGSNRPREGGIYGIGGSRMFRLNLSRTNSS